MRITEYNNKRDAYTMAKGIAEHLVGQYPHIFTLELRKNKRENKIFLDYLGNAYG